MKNKDGEPVQQGYFAKMARDLGVSIAVAEYLGKYKHHLNDDITHAMKGRDDYLMNYLAYNNGGVILSKDNFNDAKYWHFIPPFTYYLFCPGDPVQTYTITPTLAIPKAGKVTLDSNVLNALLDI